MLFLHPVYSMRSFLTVHSYVPHTQNRYLAQQRPLIHVNWENKTNKLLSKGAERIIISISSKNAHFLSSLIEVIFLENSSSDGILLDPHRTWPRGEATRLSSNRATPASEQRLRRLRQPGVSRQGPSRVSLSHLTYVKKVPFCCN